MKRFLPALFQKCCYLLIFFSPAFCRKPKSSFWPKISRDKNEKFITFFPIKKVCNDFFRRASRGSF